MSNYPAGYREPEDLDHYLERLEDGEPCYHAGCLSHVTHPCEGCGRIAGVSKEGLYDRLASLSKALESSGRIDEHDYPDAYATILDAMNFMRNRETPNAGVTGQPRKDD